MDRIINDLSLLLTINDDIASIKDSEKLFLTIFRKLHDFYGIKISGIALLDKSRENLGFIIAKIDEKATLLDSTVWLKTFSVNSLPFGIDISNPQIANVRIEHFHSMQTLQENQLSFEEIVHEFQIKTLLFLPMKTGGEFIGYLVYSPQEYEISAMEEDITLNISNLIGSAISNVFAYEELKYKETEKEMQIRLLVDLITIKEKDKWYNRLAAEIDKLIPCNYISLYAEQQGMNILKTFSLYKDNNGNFKIMPHSRNITLSLVSIKSKTDGKNKPNNLEILGEEFTNLCEQFIHLKHLKIKHSINSLLLLQYVYEGVGELNLVIGRSNSFLSINKKDKMDLMLSQNKNSFFSNKEIELGMQLLPQLGLALANLYAFEEIQILTKKLEQEKNYFLDEINLTNSFQEIIGNSQQINNSLNKVKQVAPLDATVLILGETGTGKELIAKALHNLSKRKENAFITVNCAALPSQLIESELFGHEKGSFTSAIERRIGKFEVANNGTIFLDEIGELPLEIQAKLLRVIQEKEFERLGGKTTIISDVRIITATNRDLEKEVEQGRFRADLFFRLNVFPIIVPPLRERKDDIPLLIKYFIDKYSKKVGKNSKSIKKNDLDMLVNYDWPGNIRELEHFIERAIIISEGSNLNFDKLLGGSLKNAELDLDSFKSLSMLEKEHIINALKLSNGKITGEKSAAQLLKINGKTLASKMRKLKIKREVVFTPSSK